MLVYDLYEVNDVGFIYGLDPGRDYRTTMLHNDINLLRLMLYEQYIGESKLSRMSKNLIRGILVEQNQPRFKKSAQNQDSSSAPKVNLESGSVSQGVKPTCSIF